MDAPAPQSMDACETSQNTGLRHVTHAKHCKTHVFAEFAVSANAESGQDGHAEHFGHLNRENLVNNEFSGMWVKRVYSAS